MDAILAMVDACTLRTEKQPVGGERKDTKFTGKSLAEKVQDASRGSYGRSVSEEVANLAVTADKMNTIFCHHGKTLDALGHVQGIRYIHSGVSGFNVAGENEAVVARVSKAIMDLGSDKDTFAKQLIYLSRPLSSQELPAERLSNFGSEESNGAIASAWDSIVPSRMLQQLDETIQVARNSVSMEDTQPVRKASHSLNEVVEADRESASAPCEHERASTVPSRPSSCGRLSASHRLLDVIDVDVADDAPAGHPSDSISERMSDLSVDSLRPCNSLVDVVSADLTPKHKQDYRVGFF